jgi:anti-sigma regulatory factor (Ser/Thr protein kinase)
MTQTAPARPQVQHSVSALLPAGPAAAGAARRCVLAAIESWGVPADSYVAALLTSELVTNAIRYAGSSVRLCVMCSCGHLRVYVHDSSCAWPAVLEAAADSEQGRGLRLVDSLAADWGCYGTSAGKVVYFALALAGEPAEQ